MFPKKIVVKVSAKITKTVYSPRSALRRYPSRVRERGRVLGRGPSFFKYRTPLHNSSWGPAHVFFGGLDRDRDVYLGQGCVIVTIR